MDFDMVLVLMEKMEKNPPPIEWVIRPTGSIYKYIYIIDVYSYLPMGFYTCPAGFLLSAARLEEILPGQFRSVP